MIRTKSEYVRVEHPWVLLAGWFVSWLVAWNLPLCMFVVFVMLVGLSSELESQRHSAYVIRRRSGGRLTLYPAMSCSGLPAVPKHVYSVVGQLAEIVLRHLAWLCFRS